MASLNEFQKGVAETGKKGAQRETQYMALIQV